MTAAALLITGVAAATFTIWQIVETTAAEPDLRGPAPVLIGDAPPPITSTPVDSQPVSTLVARETATMVAEPPLASPSATPLPRNLAPATFPDEVKRTTTEPAEENQAIRGGTTSASHRQPLNQPAPTYLRIPGIAVDSLIVPVGLNERGEMASPEDYSQVGWWQFGAAPGDYGRAVLAGHVDSPTDKAIFYGIDRLVPGDEIFVGNQEGGPELRFIVSGAALYHVDHAPVDQIFGPSSQRELVLITCGGSFDHDSGQYLYRRVVFAKLAP